MDKRYFLAGLIIFFTINSCLLRLWTKYEIECQLYHFVWVNFIIGLAVYL
ncbi:MAG: hypothetical protein HUJ87_16460 [Fusobacterium varium]|nr:hypothetical protein [Fusobacterium varium]MCF0172084.1 hypothetical protein [Fusobacterium varium]